MLALLAGCGGGAQSHALLNPVTVPAAASAVAGSHSIYVATTREPAANAAEVFGGGRADTTAFARVDVSVPAGHKIGEIERPKGKAADPGKFFTATGITGYPEATAFERTLRADIASRGGRALVMIHGYRNHFDDAVYRITQVVQDSGYTGTPVLFSWASSGKTLDYVYDNNSATAARDSLEGTLRLLVRAGAKRIDIVAHSMGNWVTMEALRQLAITGDRDLDGRLGDVVLASPDIDVDVFKAQMRRYGQPDKPFFIMVSRDDRALGFSRLIAGNRPRLGDYADDKDIAKLGVVVVDLTGVSSNDSLNHAKFADNPLLVKLLGERLNEVDGLGTSESAVTDHINALAQGLGQSVVSAAQIVITTPVTVLSVAVGN